MRKSDVEKSLKRFLKRKVSYSLSLLIAFMITGGMSLGAGITTEEIQESKGNLLTRVQIEKKEIQQKLIENQKRLKILNLDLRAFLKEGDFYSKPLEEKYMFSIIGGYKKADSVKKNWQGSLRKNTSMDDMRERFNDVLSQSKETGEVGTVLGAAQYTYTGRNKGYKSSGWINMNSSYSSSTNIYDAETNLFLLPVVKAPKVLEPSVPNVVFTVPTALDPIPITSPAMINVNINPIVVTAPSIMTPSISLPGTPVQPGDITVTINEPTVTINSIVVNINPVDPVFTINPLLPSVSMNVKVPESIVNPNPEEPERDIAIVEPDADPFSDFRTNIQANSNVITNPSHSANWGLADNIDITGGTFWSGVKDDGSGNIGTTVQYAAVENATQTTSSIYQHTDFEGSRTFDRRHITILNLYNGRWNTTTKPLHHITGGIFHAAGNINNETEPNVAPGTNFPAAIGTAVFHIAGDALIEDIEVSLYGKAAFTNMEAMRGGQVTLTNTEINVKGDNNSIFHLRGRAPRQDYSSFKGSEYSTKLSVDADITVDTKKNSIYVAKNFTSGLRVENNGEIKLNGASNIGFSFLTWTPDKSKYIGGGNGAASVGESNVNDYVPYVKMKSSNPMKLYGDENVGIFFNSKIAGVNSADSEYRNHTINYDVGIHQGYFDLYFDIGGQLNSNASMTTQATEGQIASSSLKPGYSDETVDGSVGVFAQSGQRIGVDVYSLYKDSLTPHTSGTLLTENDLVFLKKDSIHNLIMDNFNITFGKYSKNGFMFLAKNGTVIEIQDNITSSFSDGINGTATIEGNTSLGTIIAYAEGTWTAAATGLTEDSLYTGMLENAPTEIIVDKKLNLMSREGIAFFAKDGGKITVTKNAEGYGYGSIIGYADNGEVIINSDIKAVDSNVAASSNRKYENIGGFASAGSTVTITGDAEINGIGAFAKGINAKVLLQGTNNTVRTGVNGGLAALDGGYVEFGGGTIEHKDVTAGDHNLKLAFYADNNNSKINFTGATDLNIYNGAVFSGAVGEYTGASGTATKYNGMSNVTINLMNNGIDLGVFKNESIIWNGEAGYLSAIASIPQVFKIEDNGHWYNSYLEGGNLTVAVDVNLDGGSSGIAKGIDVFNDITMEREKVTINNGVTLNSLTGKGLVLGSNITANTAGKNTDSGYVNNGTVKVTGGNEAGIYVSYGHITNNSTGVVDVDTGIGLLGVNGSKIENSGTINSGINGNTGAVGIAGIARRVKADGSADTPELYGTDVATGVGADTSTNLVDIDNKGIINIKGENGVAIYSENNVGTAGTRGRVVIKNNQYLSLGDKGVGVMSVGSNGGTIILTDTGGTGITVGKSGIGIYGENSDITLIGNPYEIEIKDGGIGILAVGDSVINTGKLKVNYTGGTSGTATGIAYEGASGTQLVNNIDIEIATPTGMTRTVSGVYAFGGGELINKGKITAASGKAYGIILEGVDIDNQETITTGISTGEGGVGIFAGDASIKTSGNNIVIQGTNAIGIYAKNSALTGNKKIEINQGTGNLLVNGKESIGVYLKDNSTSRLELDNKSIIDIAGSSSSADRKIGIFLDDAQNTANTSTGTINVAGSSILGNNIGVYSKNSYFNQAGIINVSGINNIGIYTEAVGVNSSTVKLGTGTINVKTDTMSDGYLSLGVYGSGNNINIDSAGSTFKVEANSVGIYLEGGSTSKTIGNYNFNLSSDSSNKMGIGAFYKGGAFADSGTIKVNSTSTALNGTNPVRPIGVYYGSGSIKNVADIEIISGSDEVIGMYGSNIGTFTNSGNIILNAEGIGAYFTGTNVINSGIVNINATDAYGLYFKGGNSSSSGNINASSSDTVGAIISGTGASFTNNAGTIITASGNSSIGTYAEDGGTFINKGTINALVNGSIGAFAKMEL